MTDRIDQATYDLYCHLPSQLLIKSIVNYFKSEASGKFGKLFAGNIYPYRRDDTQIQRLPSLNVSPSNFSITGDLAYFIGNIKLEFSLPPSLIRDRQTEAGIVIGESLFLLTRNPRWLNTIIQNVPALKELGTNMTANYEPLYPEKKDSLQALINLNYAIDIAGYFLELL